MEGQYNATLPTLPDGDTTALFEVDSRGRLRIVNEASSASLPAAIHSIADVTVPTGSAAAITTTNPTATLGVTVTALSTNTASVRVGDSSITTTRGVELTAGTSYFFAVSDPAQIYSISATASQKLAVVWQ
ncbi:MAG TPA: hypothetical protein VMT89_09395 [Candidatus Acidoferrales bacterium]|nr:hypothetical protein [Candidatus Acidoferrales bacterium]